MSRPFVSVVVPVFNDPDRLRRCLGALEAQTYPADRYEVIAVDNGSDASPAPLVAPFRRARLAHEPRPGSYAARNRGVRLARGAVLAFTDADCIPARDWLERGVARLLAAPGCGLVAGKVELFFARPGAPTAAELYDALTALDQRAYAEVKGFGATANLFTFRSVFDAVGPFDQTLKSGGDRVWGRRVAAAGYRLIYGEDVRVRHPARRSLGEVCRKRMRLIGGQQEEKRQHAYPLRRFIRDVAHDLIPPVEWSRRLCRHENWQMWHRDTKLVRMAKLRVVAIVCLVDWVSAWERIRLQLGGEARR